MYRSEKNPSRRRFLTSAAGLAAATLPRVILPASAAKPAKKFKVIDSHLHLFNSAIQGTNGIPKYMPDATVEHHLKLMDAGGVDQAFLISYNAEDIALEIRGRGESPVVMLRVVNKKYQIDCWKAHKDRFWWFPSHPNPIHEDCVEELERYFEMGASGFKMLPLFQGLFPDHPGYRPLYEVCKRRKKPIILDPSWWYLGRGLMGYGINESRQRQEMVKAFTSYAEFAKLLGSVFEAYPTVPFSLAHCGTAKGEEDYEYIFALISGHANLSCDVGMIRDFSPAFVERLVKAVGAKKVMYGTDAPYWYKGDDSYKTARFRWTLIADECPFLSDAEKQAILAGNAERFLKGLLPA